MYQFMKMKQAYRSSDAFAMSLTIVRHVHCAPPHIIQTLTLQCTWFKLVVCIHVSSFRFYDGIEKHKWNWIFLANKGGTESRIWIIDCTTYKLCTRKKRKYDFVPRMFQAVTTQHISEPHCNISNEHTYTSFYNQVYDWVCQWQCAQPMFRNQMKKFEKERFSCRGYSIIKIQLKGKFPQTTMWIRWIESNFTNPTVKVWADLDNPFKRNDYAKLCVSLSLGGTLPEYVISQEDNSPLTLYRFSKKKFFLGYQ